MYVLIIDVNYAKILSIDAVSVLLPKASMQYKSQLPKASM